MSAVSWNPQSRRRRRAEINIVPLIDVLTVLIFFFVVTMELRTAPTLNITMPKIETAGQNQRDNTPIVAIDQDGKLYAGEDFTEVEDEELQAILETHHRLTQDRKVLLFAHEDAPLKHITRVMDICRAANLDRIQLQSR